MLELSQIRQDFPLILCNPYLHHRDHKGPSLVPALGHTAARVRSKPSLPTFLRSILILSFYSSCILNTSFLIAEVSTKDLLC